MYADIKWSTRIDFLIINCYQQDLMYIYVCVTYVTMRYLRS